MDVLLCSHETTQEVLLLVLVSLAQERHGHVSVGTKERHKNDQKAETPLLWRSLTELGLLSLEKRGLQRDLIAAFQYIKWTEEKDGERLFSGACREKSRVNSFKLKEKVRKKDLDWIKGRLFIYLLFFFYVEGGETLKQFAQRSCGCIGYIGRVQSWVCESFEQPGLIKDVPAYGRGSGVNYF